MNLPSVAASARASWPGRLFTKLGQDNAFNWAVIIAWNFLQSLFPIVLVMAAVIGLLLGRVGVGSQRVYSTVISIIPDHAAQQQALQALSLFHQRSGIFFLVGFAGLVWSGAGLFRTMEQAFAVIYHTHQRPLLKGVLMSIGMVFLLTLFGGLMLVTTTLLGLLHQLPYLPSLLANGLVAFLLQAAIGVGAGFALFLCIYFVVPNRRQDWGKVWPGALLAGALFEVLSLVFPLYLRLTGTAATYGKSFGLLFLLMVYFYFLGIVTMLGVEVNSMLYPVPVEQPNGRESLVKPTQADRPAPLAAPPAAEKSPRPEPPRHSPVKGMVAVVLLWLAGPLRRRARPS
ncbi:MAG TPA: YihY/virulence factor BrkB family protein [Candidatus Dormibacteraeota bacterium]|nr:YihY/virulence factor BrkB family protein [Candidatus Dormibacteraeota bacterium]